MAEIVIPNSAAIRAARGFLPETNWSLDGSETTLRFHDRWCHMQPWIISAIAAWGLEAQRRCVTVRVENGNRAGYAWRFGLADYLGVEPAMDLTEHEEAGRFVALRTIRDREDHGRLMADVVTLLHLAEEPEQARAVHYVLSELVRNVREHSRSEDGAVVCAQYYRGGEGRRRYVSVGVADTGIGVHDSLRHNYPKLQDDSEALLTAIKPGVTGAQPDLYGGMNNAGAGLFYTRRLAETSDEYFAIASGNAMFRTSTATAKRRPADEELVFPISPYPGTVVCAQFRLEDEVAFDDFLNVTGRAFSRLDEQLRETIDERVRFT